MALTVLFVALGLGACGRRGPLEAPQASAPASQAAAAPQRGSGESGLGGSTVVDTSTADQTTVLPAAIPRATPKASFLLDPLL